MIDTQLENNNELLNKEQVNYGHQQLQKHESNSINKIENEPKELDFVEILREKIRKNDGLSDDLTIRRQNHVYETLHSKPIDKNKNFSVEEDVLILSAYQFYLENNNRVKLLDIISKMTKDLKRTFKSVKKRFERIQKLNESQIKVFFKYYAKYKEMSRERKIVFSSNGDNMFLCNLNKSIVNKEEKKEFNVIKEDIFKNEQQYMNKALDTISSFSIHDKTNENKDVIEEDEHILAQQNTRKEEKNHEITIKQSDTIPSIELSDKVNNNENMSNITESDKTDTKAKIHLPNLLTLDDIITNIDTEILENDKDKPKLNYLNVKSQPISYKFSNNQITEKLKALEIDDPIDIIKISSDSEDNYSRIVCDIKLFNLSENYETIEKPVKLNLNLNQDLDIPTTPKYKRKYLDVTDKNFISEGYELIKKRHNITDINSAETGVQHECHKKIKSSPKNCPSYDLILIEPIHLLKRTKNELNEK